MKRLVLYGFALMAAAAHAESWVVTTDLWGNPSYQLLTLDRADGQLSGDLDGDRLTGRASGNRFVFAATDSRGATYSFDARRAGDALSGEADFPDTNRPDMRAKHRFSARRIPDRPAGGPRTIDYRPVTFSNSFDAGRLPVLMIWPGDIVRTETIDSGGVDAQGRTRALFGNPQTGPFFVAGAAPGDTLVVHIRRLSLNRDWADSLDMIVGRALPSFLAAKAADLGKPVKWKLDRANGRASPEGAGGALAGLSVPVKPMLGGLAVAPGFGSPPVSTGDTARFGGNMDFNEVVAGNIVYLPVQQPGALLYLGDGHAAQGDGETSQYALETSLDVEFSVELVKGWAINLPRVESPTQIMALGQAGSLDEALKSATGGLIQWLQQDYGLSLSEAAQLLGAAVRYDVANLAGRSVGVSARIDKVLLPAQP